MKFYFTYGYDHRPYSGGWTEVIAPDIETAVALYKAIHPPKEGDVLPCADVYDEEAFSHTIMASSKGNFGQFCHEVISIQKND